MWSPSTTSKPLEFEAIVYSMNNSQSVSRILTLIKEPFCATVTSDEAFNCKKKLSSVSSSIESATAVASKQFRNSPGEKKSCEGSMRSSSAYT